ncbi:L1 [Macaca fascicularis papillomavirus 2]|uniref:Major capsid protein L1 n=1 Tax=Macaca fascicularis papillomavirus 2 TaxID=915424 RepID=F8QPQ0_9PAPI|nr:L1 [Macaca fascicularis papillomavirus 2]ADQ39305.1 L1 [Macaca fascicularis papillomavirus 2]
MSYWLPATGKVYLPPSTPVARVQSTDEYIHRTNIFYHANSDRLLIVGHPYFNVLNSTGDKVEVPKVSGNQFRAFRLLLPDPNRFALADMSIYDPDKERLVWACRGIEIGRGQPLGVGTTGHPLFNRLLDTENPRQYPPQGTKDDRQDVSFDPKQVQMFIIGCEPCIGEHWDRAKACAGVDQTGLCPPVELVNTTIQDGDMVDLGFGAINNITLSFNKSDVSLDLVNSIAKYPDFLKMNNDVYGNSCFFYARREQLYARHYFARGGFVGDIIPDGTVNQDHKYYLPGDSGGPRSTLASSIYFPTVSGSLVSSDAQLFNRPFWLQRAQGHNNGICWQNQLFVTMVDNTRNTNITISVSTEAAGGDSYDATKIREYLRHMEEFEISVILQLCKVPLDAEVLAQINAMNSRILENWQLGFVPSPENPILDQYRYLNSLATRCPDQEPPKEPEDPYAQYNFWVVDLTERLSLDLDQYSLGRKFLFQAGLQSNSTRVRNPARLTSNRTSAKKGTKRKRT